MFIEPLLEFEDDGHDVVEKRRERLFNPKPLKRAPFSKGYIEQNLRIHVQFGIGSGSNRAITRYYLAVFECLSSGLEVQEFDADILHGGSEVVVHEDLTGEMEFPVLIPVGKVTESGERVFVGGIRSIVRLNPLEEFNVGLMNAPGLVFPANTRSFSRFRASMNTGIEGVEGDNGKLSFTGRLASVPDDQLPSQMIESGPDIVDDIPDDGAPPKFWPFSDFDPREVLAGLGLEIVDNFIRLAPSELINAIDEFTEVYLRPPHL